MQFEFQKGIIFKKVIDSIKDLVKETNLSVSNDGLSLQAMDSAHVSLIEISLLDSVRISCDKHTVIGINMENICKILRILDLDTFLTVYLIKNRLHFKSGVDERKTEFSVPLMDVEMDRHEVPEFTYPNKLQINSSEFNKIVGNMKELGCDLTIRLKGKTVDFWIDSDISGSLTMTDTRFVIEEEIEQLFSLKFLNMFCKATPLSDAVILEMGSGFPLRLSFIISDADYVKFYLAPKVDD
tara:strand:+ start:707 stop:1426 length:720 start_codon:yes stop_codon:yes gene_type:complete